MGKNILEFCSDKGNKYYFDNSTGFIIPDTLGLKYVIQNTKFDESELKNYLLENERIEEKEAERIYQYCMKLISNGYFAQVDKYNSVDDAKVLSLNSNSSQLILVLTEECNLRCHYCVYSEQYEYQKGYNDVSMSLETARKAIDQYNKWFNEKRLNGFQGNPRISFYGGEPFLEFDLIKQIVSYCESIQFNVEFLATTNGTVMTDEIIEFIVEHNFNISFSLDGNQLNNDRNRVFTNGKGTHKLIENNIEKFQNEKLKRNKMKPFNFVCCYDSHTDMVEVVAYFEELQKRIGDFGIMYNEIYKYDTEYYNYCIKRHERGDFDYDEMTFKHSIECLRKKFIEDSKLKIETSDPLRLLFQSFYLYKNRCQGANGVLDNACAVGDKMCFDAEGKLYVCEKATQQFELGNVNDGMDWDAAKRFTNDFLNMKNEHCSSCNISRMCEVCYVHFMKDNTWVFNHEFCNDKKSQVKRAFEVLYTYLEEDNLLFDIK